MAATRPAVAGVVRSIDNMALTNNTGDAGSPIQRTNFPLPRELRDRIYEYLLHHDHVEAAPYYTRPQEEQGSESKKNERETSAAHTYKFQIAILAVNREMRDEASKVLVQNDFVVVSFEWPGLEEAKHLFDVPMITETKRHVARFDKHILRVHIQHPDKSLRAARDLVIRSCLMVAADLPCFCQMMQWTFFSFPAYVRLAMRMHGMPDNEWRNYTIGKDQKDYRVATKLQFRSVEDQAITAHRETSLLRAFESMIIGNQKVVVKGTSHTTTVQLDKLQRLMSPEVVWVSAIGWRMLEIAQSFKAKVDDLVIAGKVELAVRKYSNIIWTMKSQIFELRDKPFDSDCGLPVGLLLRTMIDVTSTAGFLYLSIGAIMSAEHVRGAGDWMIAHLRAIPDPQKNISPNFGRGLACINASSWMNVMVNLCTSNMNIGEMKHSSLMLAQAGRMFGGTEQFKQDTQVLQKLVESDPRHVSHPEDIRKSSSACQLPPMIFNTPLPAGVQKPNVFEGLQDVVHLNKVLDRADEERARMTPEQIAQILREDSD